MIMLFMFLCVSLFWGAICTVMTNDITEVATEQKEENIKLQAEYDKLSQEYARMKMAYEETYELFTTCQESTSWYEQFYYDNVDPTTGEIEGNIMSSIICLLLGLILGSGLCYLAFNQVLTAKDDIIEDYKKKV